MTLSIEELIATAQPRTLEVRVCARGDLVDRHAALVNQLEALADEASVAPSEEMRRIAEEIVEVEAEQEAATVTITIQSVSRRVWTDLLAAHPPRDKIDRGLDHNPITFPTAAVAACARSPKLTVEQAEQLAGALPPGEWKKLWLAVVGLNLTETPHPKLAAAMELLRESSNS